MTAVNPNARVNSWLYEPLGETMTDTPDYRPGACRQRHPLPQWESVGISLVCLGWCIAAIGIVGTAATAVVTPRPWVGFAFLVAFGFGLAFSVGIVASAAVSIIMLRKALRP